MHPSTPQSYKDLANQSISCEKKLGDFQEMWSNLFALRHNSVFILSCVIYTTTMLQETKDAFWCSERFWNKSTTQTLHGPNQMDAKPIRDFCV